MPPENNQPTQQPSDAPLAYSQEVISVDDRITAENIRMHQAEYQLPQQGGGGLEWLAPILGSRVVWVGAAAVMIITVVAGLTLAKPTKHASLTKGNSTSQATDDIDNTNDPGETLAGEGDQQSFDDSSSQASTDDGADLGDDSDSLAVVGSDDNSGTDSSANDYEDYSSEELGDTGSYDSGDYYDDYTDAVPPSMPENVTATPSSVQISVNWNRVDDATQYVVAIANNPVMENARQLISGDPSVVIPELSANTQYFIQVQAVGPNGASDWSDAVSTTTQPAVPAGPVLPGGVANIVATVNSNRSVKLSWDAAHDAQRYTVVRATDAGMTTGRKEYAPTEHTSYVMNDLKDATTYYFTVRATNSNGLGDVSLIVSVRTKLASPKIASAGMVSPTSAELSFTRVHGAKQYEVQYSTDKTFKGARTQSTTKTRITVSDLRKDAVYYFQVRAKADADTSNWSATTSVKTRLKSTNITAVTYNILGSIHQAQAAQHGGSSAARADRVVTTLKQVDADIVGMQEVQEDQYNLFVQKLGQYEQFPGYWKSHSRAGTFTLFWKKDRFEKIDSGFIAVPWYGDYAMRPGHAFPWVKLKERATGTTFYFINAHFVAAGDPSRNPGSAADGAPKREREAQLVAGFVNKLPAGSNVYVTGDLNSRYTVRPDTDGSLHGDRSRLPYCVLTKSGRLIDGYDARKGRHGYCPTRTLGSIDHVYVSDGIRVHTWSRPSNNLTRNSSDHSPVIIRTTVTN